MNYSKYEKVNCLNGYLEMDPNLIHRRLFELNSFHDDDQESDTKESIYLDKNLIFPVEYKNNSMSYRSKNFECVANVLILGCSQTLGDGMIDEFTWPNILCKKLKTDFHRLAVGGDSMQAQVVKAFEYFRTIGNPKLIVATFPLFRIELPKIKNFFVFKKENKNLKSIANVDFSNQSVKKEKYIKSPFDPEEIIPREYALFLNFSFIAILEQYCRSNNISIIWNIWEDVDKNIYNYVKSKPHIKHVLDNYHVDEFDKENPFTYYPDFNIPMSCHSEYKDHPLFNKAADWTKERGGHWSMHKHIHVAESFYREIKKRNLI